MKHERATFKAILSTEATVEDNGDHLIVRGRAADFTGLDRDGEIFEPGSFDRAVKAYMASNPVLLHHHKPDKQLGDVIDYSLSPDGLDIKAKIPKPAHDPILKEAYDKIRDGYTRGFSVGGAFFRRLGKLGHRIFDVDLQEISMTPLPVNPRTLLSAGGAKAIAADLEWKSIEDPADPVLTKAVGQLERVFEQLAAQVD